MQQKTKVILIIAVCVFILCSCGIFANQDNYKHNIEVKEKQSTVAEEVLSAITSQDEEKLYYLFSPINRDNCDIEAQIKEMFDCIPVGSFDLSLIEKKADGGGTSYDDGRITKHSFGCKCDKIFDEEGNEYLISFGYMVENEKDPDQIGMETLLIAHIERNDQNNQYYYEIIEEYTIGDITLYYKSY